MNWTFESAEAFHRLWNQRDAEADGAYDQWQDAEAFLLSTPPTSLQQVEYLIALVCDAGIGGGRSDGRDVEALQNIRLFLKGLDQKVADGATVP